MSGLLFKNAPSAPVSSPNRADVVCFIGFVARSTAPLPASVKAWLQNHGWRPHGTAVADDDALLNTPVPLDSFEAFDRLFAWENRPPSPHAFPFTTWLGAAVRSFFRQGGARCYVVRVGDPGVFTPRTSPSNPANPLTAEQQLRLSQLFPGFSTGTPPSPADPSTWKGLGVLLGLGEAAFVCFPDLPELVSDATLEPAGLAPLPPSPEVFVTCSPEITLPRDEVRQISASPACTAAGYLRWRAVVRHAALFVRARRSDVQLLLALPLPSADLGTHYTQDLEHDGHVLGLQRDINDAGGIASAFVQLSYPWLATTGSEALPGNLEPPDAVLAGVLARAIPELGVAHSVGRRRLRGVHGFYPALTNADVELDTPRDADPALIHRVSLLGRTPDAPRVLSDVTTSRSTAHRPACVGRLTAAILRTARHLGDSVVFEPSGEILWQQIRTQLERLLADFYTAGALHGASADEAYSIRCDATTTSQNDLDNGRVVAEVRFAPAHPVGLIVVVLALREGEVAATSAPA
jgi:hypothetical protein